MRKVYLTLMISFLVFVLTGCSNEENTQPAKTIVKSFNVALNTSNSIPVVNSRNETGSIQMNLYSDNSLEFTISVNNLASTDALTVAHVHSGDVLSTGGVLIGLVDNSTISFSESKAYGTISLSLDQVSALKGDNVYVNVHSNEEQSGLLRGQIDKEINNAYNILLSPSNSVPAITDRAETGIFYMRLVGSMLYYKVVVNNLKSGDAITAAHIHEGNATSNGGVFVNLNIGSTSQLDTSLSISLDTEGVSKLNTDELYVNVHSRDYSSGLLRGQIR